MTEVDMKIAESVQTSLSLFEQDINKQLYRSVSYWEMENSANIDKHEVYRRRIEELSAQLELTECDRDRYKEECKKTQALLSMLESEYEVAIDQLVEFSKQHGDLLQVVDKLKPMKEEVLHLEAKLTAAEESKVEALRKSELMENALNMEKEKNMALMIHVAELNAGIVNLAATKAEKARSCFFAGMEEELHIATAAIIQSQQQVEQMIMQLDLMTYLENMVMEKTILSDYFQLELMQTKELISSEMELMENIIDNKPNYNMSIEAEAKRMEEELQIARRKADDLHHQVETLTAEMQYIKDKKRQSNENELELLAEIAMLKSELHRNKSRIASAEAAEARAMSARSGLYLAVQELAMELESAKKETQSLKSEMACGIIISVEEYESLTQKADMADDKTEELEAANAQISALKFASEEAVRRAQQAEKAKEAIEEQLRQWRKQQLQRRATSEQLHERKQGNLISKGKTSAYQPQHRSTSFPTQKNVTCVPLAIERRDVSLMTASCTCSG